MSFLGCIKVFGGKLASASPNGFFLFKSLPMKDFSPWYENGYILSLGGSVDIPYRSSSPTLQQLLYPKMNSTLTSPQYSLTTAQVYQKKKNCCFTSVFGKFLESMQNHNTDSVIILAPLKSRSTGLSLSSSSSSSSPRSSSTTF